MPKLIKVHLSKIYFDNATSYRVTLAPLAGLQRSIRECNGLMEPLVIRRKRVEIKGKVRVVFFLIAGFRRVAALGKLPKKFHNDIPCMLYTRKDYKRGASK